MTLIEANASASQLIVGKLHLEDEGIGRHREVNLQRLAANAAIALRRIDREVLAIAEAIKRPSGNECDILPLPMKHIHLEIRLIGNQLTNQREISSLHLRKRVVIGTLHTIQHGVIGRQNPFTN